MRDAGHRAENPSSREEKEKKNRNFASDASRRISSTPCDNNESTRYEGMTERASRRGAARTSFCLLVAFVLSCVISGSEKVLAFPQPEPGFYGDNFADDVESYLLLNRLKLLTENNHRVNEQIEREIADEREITDEQLEIQAVLEAKARERAAGRSQPSDYSEEPEPEALPIPAAMVHHEQHPGKRHGMNAVSYMSLCHFKICNMGRKRQSK